MNHFDVVHAADPRYIGGTGAALRGEIVGCTRWGISCALLPYIGTRSRIISAIEPRLDALLREIKVPVLPADQPFSCDILLAHHPTVFEFMPQRAVKLQAKRVVCVLHHPLFDGNGKKQYDIGRVERSLLATFAAPVVFAPISPVIRDQALKAGLEWTRLLKHDLTNVIDEAEWAERSRPAPRSRSVIGRHSRADPLKWPDRVEDILAAYPADDRFDIRILGEVTLPETLITPANWTMLPFSDKGVSDFLAGLDFYVYFHSARWIEAFGIAIAEAMAAGLVTILPPQFEPMFEDGAVYSHPKDVTGILDHFMARPDEYARQSRAARRLIMDRYSVAAYKGRMQQLYNDLDLAVPRSLVNRVSSDMTSLKPLVPPILPPAKSRLLMVAGNGIGLGHITRLMAIAKYLPDWVEPMFLTLSLGTTVLRQAGYSADYIPAHRKIGVSSESWNAAFALELLAAIDACSAAMVVFDGNDPFPGIVEVMKLRTDLAWVWVRRGFWQPHQNANPNNLHLFDMVIEPGELAADDDGGGTRNLSGAERVGPVLLSDPLDRLDRITAATHLGVDPARKNVVLQLGARQNFDFASLRSALLDTLSAFDVDMLEIENPLANYEPPVPGDPPRQKVYPLFPLSNAIDLMITTPGYNAFHESIYGGIPTLFVPNEAAEMDDQLLRAAFATSAGLALMMTVADTPRADAKIKEALSPEFSAMVRHRSGRLMYNNGAEKAAHLIRDFLISVRTDRELHKILPRRFLTSSSL